MDDLDGIRDSLLDGLRPPAALRPDQGELAFERHILLAIRFHKAAGLNQTLTGEGEGWREYFSEHFPKPDEWREEDAKWLWTDWRCGLVKWESPKSRVTVTHGQPDAHWHREPGGTLCVNLESMWDDFEASVESFLCLLQRDDDRRAEAVRRWQERSWTVRQLEVAQPTGLEKFGGKAPATHSASAMAPPSRPA